MKINIPKAAQCFMWGGVEANTSGVFFNVHLGAAQYYHDFYTSMACLCSIWHKSAANLFKPHCKPRCCKAVIDEKEMPTYSLLAHKLTPTSWPTESCYLMRWLAMTKLNQCHLHALLSSTSDWSAAGWVLPNAYWNAENQQAFASSAVKRCWDDWYVQCGLDKWTSRRLTLLNF